MATIPRRIQKNPMNASKTNEEQLDRVCEVTTTFPDKEKAMETATWLVQNRYVACAQVGSPVNSIYEWKGQIERDTEYPVTFKTVKSKIELLHNRLIEMHPYEVPQFLVFMAEERDDPYQEWIYETLLG